MHQNLKERRLSLNISRQTLATKSGIGVTTIYGIEKGSPKVMDHNIGKVLAAIEYFEAEQAKQRQVEIKRPLTSIDYFINDLERAQDIIKEKGLKATPDQIYEGVMQLYRSRGGVFKYD